MNENGRRQTILFAVLWATLALACVVLLLCVSPFATAEAQESEITEETAESASPARGQDKGHMIYFAVYYLTSKPESDDTAWDMEREFAPQASSEGAPLIDWKADASTLCRFRYADKEFYMYSAGSIAHYREYDKVYGIMQNPVDPPQVDILQSKDGYTYAGYTIHRENGYKYDRNKLLPAATRASELQGADTTSQFPKGSFDNLANITVSVYFYAPATLTVSGNDPSLGKISPSSDASFDDAVRSWQIKNIPLGTHISSLGSLSDRQGVRLWGTRTEVREGKFSSADFEQYVYAVPNSGCAVSYCDRTGGDRITVATEYAAQYYFTREYRALTLALHAHVGSDITAYLRFGTRAVPVQVQSGDHTYTVTLQDIPSGTISFAALTLTADGRTFVASSAELTETDEASGALTAEISDTLRITENVDLGELHLYETYAVTAERRALYKLHGVPLRLPALSGEGTARFIGYAQSATDTDTMQEWTANAPVELTAVYEYTLSATVVTDALQSKQYTATTRDKTVTRFPAPAEVLAWQCEGYSDDATQIHLENELNEEGKLENGKTYTAVYAVTLSLCYDLSELEENDTVTGSTENFEQSVPYLAGKFPVVRVPVTDATVTRAHYDFSGWEGYRVSEYEHAGDEIVLHRGEQSVTLRPALRPHKYTLTIDTGDERISLNVEHTESITVHDHARKEGHSIADVTAANAPENLTRIAAGRYTYENIDRDETLTVTWQIQTYVTTVKVRRYFPNEDVSVHIACAYDGQTDEQTFTDPNDQTEFMELRLPYGTRLSFTATVNKAGYNISFSSERGGESKSCAYAHTVGAKNENVYLYVSKLYPVTLSCDGEAPKTIYKYHGVPLTLPTDTFTDSEWKQTGWQNASGNTVTKLTENAATELTVVRSLFVKFTVNGTLDTTTEFVSGASVAQNANVSSQRIEKDGKTYYVAGWSTAPDSTVIEWDGAAKVFTRSATYYAVYRCADGNKTTTENATLSVHYGTRTETRNIERTVTYSGFNVYYSNDFTAESDRDYAKGQKAYACSIDFMENTDDTGDYALYAWSLSGGLGGAYFTAGQTIELGDGTNVYALYRDFPVEQRDIEHELRYDGGHVFRPMTTARTQSNTFGVYAASKTSQGTVWTKTGTATDDIAYKTEYAPLSYPERADIPYGMDATYTLLGFARSPYALVPEWTGGNRAVTEAETWYAVWSRTRTRTAPITLKHTFYSDIAQSFTVTSQATEKRTNVRITESYNGELTKITDEGKSQILSPAALVATILPSSDFLGWASAPSSTTVVWDGNRSFAPDAEQTLYPVFSATITVRVEYVCEGAESRTAEQTEYTRISCDGTAAALPAVAFSVLATEFSDREGFLGYTDGERVYMPDDTYTVQNVRSDITIKLCATYPETKLYILTYEAGQDRCEYAFAENETLILESMPASEDGDFAGWKYNGNIYNAGTEFTVSENAVLVAVYAPRHSQGDGDNNQDSDQNQGNSSGTGSDESQEKTAESGGKRCGSDLSGEGAAALPLLGVCLILLIRRTRKKLS